MHSWLQQGVRSATAPGRRARAVVAVLVVTVLVAAVVLIAGRGSPSALVRATRSEALPGAGGGPTVSTLPGESTVPVSTLPGESTVPMSTLPGATVPVSTAPGATVPATTVPAGPDGGEPEVNPEAGSADPNPWVALHPELATAPAPSWVAPGVRLSYYAIAASVAGSYHQYVEDEDGGWIDPDTGDRYRQEDIPSPAGHGYHQVTVAAMDDHLVALSIRVFGLTGVERTSPVVTLTWGGAIGFPGAGADYWLDPAVLAGVDEVVTDELKVVRMPYTIGDDVYDSLWVQLLGDDANLTWVYDTASGVLLHTASSTTGPPLTGPVAAGEGRDGSTFLTQSTFVGWRQTTLPWATSPEAGAAATVQHLDYDGSITAEVLGTPSAVLDASLAIDRVQSGHGWVRWAIARTIRSDVTPSVTESVVRVDGPAQVGALFLPPSGLAGLVEGQVLDDDPVTGAVVSVGDVEVAADDTYVTIVEQGPVEWSTAVYAVSTGVLVSTSSTNATIGTTATFDLVGWR